MMGRVAKIVMCFVLGVYLAVVAVDNIVNYPANYAFVQHVLSMDTIAGDNALRTRAFTGPATWRFAYAAIIASEAIISMLYIGTAAALWRRRHAPASAFQAAKGWMHAASLGGFLLYFGGFDIVGGEYLAMWQSPHWNGQQAAFRVYMTLLAVLIFVSQPDAELVGARKRCR